MTTPVTPDDDVASAPAATGAPRQRHDRPRRPAASAFLRRTWWIQALVVIGALGVLEAIVRAGLVNPLFVSPPSAMAGAVYDGLASGKLAQRTLVTLCEVSVSLAVACVVGVVAGYLLWRFTVVGRAYDPLLVALFSSPIILLYPIFLVLFGRTTVAIIAQGFVYGVLPTVIYSRQGFAGVRRELLKVADVTGLSAGQQFRKVLLPAAGPTIFLGVRLALTYILISVVAMEYLVKIGGIGRYVADADLGFDIGGVYAGVVMVVAMTVVLILLTYLVQRVAVR